MGRFGEAEALAARSETEREAAHREYNRLAIRQRTDGSFALRQFTDWPAAAMRVDLQEMSSAIVGPASFEI